MLLLRPVLICCTAIVAHGTSRHFVAAHQFVVAAHAACRLWLSPTLQGAKVTKKLPLGQAHLMSFELIPIGPLNPLRQLQGMKANP
jgi:hypothetical protein